MPDSREPEPGSGGIPEPDRAAVERGAHALTMFVFPGVVVPRREMAEAVLRAVMHDEDPRLGLVRTVVRTG